MTSLAVEAGPDRVRERAPASVLLLPLAMALLNVRGTNAQLKSRRVGRVVVFPLPPDFQLGVKVLSPVWESVEVPVAVRAKLAASACPARAPLLREPGLARSVDRHALAWSGSEASTFRTARSSGWAITPLECSHHPLECHEAVARNHELLHVLPVSQPIDLHRRPAMLRAKLRAEEPFAVH